MSILVTNDDGIESPGLWALAEAMSHLGDTLIVAPNKQQSGVGTSVTLHNEISIEEVPSSLPGVQAFAIGGTPSDCVILGIRRLANGRRYHLLVSGINLGANLGRDIPYSGTVMATLGGHFRGIPSMALSLALMERNEEPDFSVVARVAEFLARRIEDGAAPTNAIINTNVPNIPLDQIKGVVTTRAASTAFVRVARIEGGDRVSYSIENRASTPFPHQAHSDGASAGEEGTDIWAINSGMISITPLRIEVTDLDSMPLLEKHAIALSSELLGGKGAP